MRTAILFTGTAYNFTDSINSLKTNFTDACDADVFILTSRYNRRRRTRAGEIPSAHDPDKWHEKSLGIEVEESQLSSEEVQRIKNVFGERLKGLWFIEDLPGYSAYLEGERKTMMDTVNRHREKNRPQAFGSDVGDTSNGNVRCVVDQYNHIKKCFQLMEQYERAHGKYNYVVRARLDFVCPFKFDISHYYLNHDHPYLFVLGSFREPHDKFEWGDEFCFFGRRDTAQKVFNNLNQMGHIIDKMGYNTIHNKNEFLFAPETQWSLLLHKHNIDVINLKIYRSAMWTNRGDYDYMNYMFRREVISVDYEYKLVCKGPSDINEHLPILKEYGEKCKHITELGTRYGNSTIAFMAARPEKFITYDVQYNSKLDYLELVAKDNSINFEIRIENPQEIEQTDLLFIDTDHHVDQCSKELMLHADKVNKYLIFHDVVSFWEKGQGYEKGGGLKYAIEPFMASHPEWKQVYRAENNNGLLILERC